MKNCDVIELARKKSLANSLLINFENSYYDEMFIDALLKAILCGKIHAKGHKCNVCEKIEKKLNPDVFFVERGQKNSTGVAEIKSLLQEFNTYPNESKFKIFIIKECEFLTVAAQNALLKMLEEPPVYVIFILLTENVSLLLPTVLSRVQQFNASANLTKIDEQQRKELELTSVIEELLNQIIRKNSYEIIKLIAQISNGRETFSSAADLLLEKSINCLKEIKSSNSKKLLTNLIFFLNEFDPLINLTLNLNLLTTQFLSKILQIIRNSD